ncbi:uncharacterized protein VICG_00844 [Vittaforma corneae ATCC 50505]|uniref:Uncharacterized protein n=1 Tax=Vittaforma corneae (strain ATCC 50505) TaxID=993615 RepID=L2GN01_VITCO|nr:uncharacterized protein VICG_00844 [Vittaforma corneae ATCC 50505]ELA42201.1 hypothetical protein VICG_00844 [Vittaforma corneae ATCC 50505]
MIPREDDRKDSLNLLIYEYLLKNDFQKTANSFKEETGIAEYKIADSQPMLSLWYNNFLETVEVRSGQKMSPDTLNRIEGIMLKLENEKQRYARLRSPPGKPQHMMRRPIDPRVMNGMPNDPYSASSSPATATIHPAPPSSSPILTEYKKIDLGISALIHSNFCPLNNILIVFSSDLHFYFYNLSTNEIEYDFQISQRCLKLLRVKEVKSTIYMAYSSEDYSIRLCKYENAEKSDIKIFEFDSPFKSFCISHDTLYIFDEMNTIKSFTFLGVCTGVSQSVQALSIECVANKLLTIDASKIAEYDIRLNAETAILGRSRFPIVKIKGDDIFLILNDSIQAIDGKMGSVVSSVKCSLPSKDVALLFNTIAVCTVTDLFYATDIIPLRNPMELDSFICFNTKGLIIVSSDGIVTLFTGHTV